MNKKQFESYHNLKEVNAFLKANKSEAFLKAEKDSFGDYRLKWDCNSSNLPDKLRILKYARDLKDQFYRQLREKIKNEYFWNIDSIGYIHGNFNRDCYLHLESN